MPPRDPWGGSEAAPGAPAGRKRPGVGTVLFWGSVVAVIAALATWAAELGSTVSARIQGMFDEAFWTSTVVASDMEPTLAIGDVVTAFRVREPEGAMLTRGAVVVFAVDGAERILRLAGMPGDDVSVSESGAVRVTPPGGQEPRVYCGEPNEAAATALALRVPDHSYFLVGDNCAEAVDSRASSLGPIPGDAMVAVVSTIAKPDGTVIMLSLGQAREGQAPDPQ